MQGSVFEQPHYIKLSTSRELWLIELLHSLRNESHNLTTALDVGCGQGFFSDILHRAGMRVQGVDGRRSNVEAARGRYSDIPFSQADVEDPTLTNLGKFDLVLCLGLLYHLENPFRAIRSLESTTEHFLIGESRIAPSRRALLMLNEEGCTEDQGLNYIALVPTESCLVKMLYASGFEFVYLTRNRPNHPDYRNHLITDRARTCFVASRTPLQLSGLRLAPNRDYHVSLWHRAFVRPISQVLRRMVSKRTVDHHLTDQFLH
jgi:SAM-dependent methyltransferase